MIDIDFETRSKCDIKMGAWRYASDKSTSILCMAYKVADGSVQLWIPGMPTPDFVKKQMWQFFEVMAHNAGFERAIWQKICVERYGWPEIPASVWRCSAAKCAAHSLPRDLKRACITMNTEIQKDDEGYRVMRKLSAPRKPSKLNPKEWWEPEDAPGDFATLYRYCKSDVGAEASLNSKLRDLSSTEYRVWALDQEINARGLYLDLAAVKGAIKIIEDHEARLTPEIDRITQGWFQSHNQILEMKRWLSETQGIEVESLGAPVIDELLQGDLPEPARRILEIRRVLSKSSTKKLYTMLGAVCPDGRVKDLLMYHGASTGRWSGKGIQIQNFPRRKVADLDKKMRCIATGNVDRIELLYGDPMDFISSCLRGMIIAAPGNTFYVADYAAIEARGVCWLAGQENTLQLFRDGKDAYRVMASTIYGKPLDMVDGGSKDGPERQLGKQAVLGCGYQMGPPKFQITCQGYKMDVSEILAEKAVSAYREINDRVVQMWWDQERAAKEAVKTRKVVKCGKIKWGMARGFLFCRLPSGRCLSYPVPKLEMGDTPWGEKREQLSYMSMNSKNQWVRTRTYGGKLVENITQATCRDIMAEAMLRLKDFGYPILFTVHDEIVCETPDGFGSVEEFTALLTEVPSWAKGFPIKAESHKVYRYQKL